MAWKIIQFWWGVRSRNCCYFCFLEFSWSLWNLVPLVFGDSNTYRSSYSGVQYSKLIANSNMYFLLHLLNFRESKWIWSWQTIACLGWVAMIYSNESRSTHNSYSPTPSPNSLCLFYHLLTLSKRFQTFPSPSINTYTCTPLHSSTLFIHHHIHVSFFLNDSLMIM